MLNSNHYCVTISAAGVQTGYLISRQAIPYTLRTEPVEFEKCIEDDSAVMIVNPNYMEFRRGERSRWLGRA